MPSTQAQETWILRKSWEGRMWFPMSGREMSMELVRKREMGSVEKREATSETLRSV